MVNRPKYSKSEIKDAKKYKGRKGRALLRREIAYHRDLYSECIDIISNARRVKAETGAKKVYYTEEQRAKLKLIGISEIEFYTKKAILLLLLQPKHYLVNLITSIEKLLTLVPLLIEVYKNLSNRRQAAILTYLQTTPQLSIDVAIINC